MYRFKVEVQTTNIQKKPTSRWTTSENPVNWIQCESLHESFFRLKAWCVYVYEHSSIRYHDSLQLFSGQCSWNHLFLLQLQNQLQQIHLHHQLLEGREDNIQTESAHTHTLLDLQGSCTVLIVILSGVWERLYDFSISMFIWFIIAIWDTPAEHSF